MRCREHELRRGARTQRLNPARAAQTPAIAGLQAGKAEFRMGRGEIVAVGRTEFEKLAGYAHANDVRPDVFVVRIAATVAEKAGERSFAAGLQRAAQYVLGNAVGVSLHGVGRISSCQVVSRR